MVDSTCVMQSFFPSSEQKGDSIRALGESVSFGRFMTQTLEWEKFSSFNQNRYLEEAQRLAKPGLVAQRKALFEAHFKKPVADKVPGLLKAANLDTKNEVRVLRNDVSNENLLGEPYKDMGSATSRCGFYIDSAMGSTNASPSLDHPQATPIIKSHSREAYHSVKNDAIAVNNCSPIILVRTEGPGSETAADSSKDLEVSHHQGSPCDTSSINHMVVEPISFEKDDSVDGFKTESNQCETCSPDSSPMALSQDKIEVQEPIDKFVLASTQDSKPAFTSSNTLTSVKKPAIQSQCKLRSQTLPLKENNPPENSKTSGIGMLNRKRILTKALQAPIKQDSSLPVTKKPLALKKLDNMKYPANSVSARGSKEHSDQVTAELERQLKTTTVPEAAPLQLKKEMTITRTDRASRQVKTTKFSKAAPPQLKKEITITPTDRVSVRKSLVQKGTSKLEIPAFSQRTGLKSVSTSVATSKSFSTHAPANQVLSDATTMGKHTIPSSNTSTFGGKSAIQFHANSLIKTGSKETLSQNNLKKSLPKALHISVGPSSIVERAKRSTTAQKCGNSRFTALEVRVSKESSNHESQQKPNGKRPSTRLDEMSNGIKQKAKHRPLTTVFIPFRFRSDERAAKRTQKLKAEAENPLQSKEKAQATTKNKLQASSNLSNNKR